MDNYFNKSSWTYVEIFLATFSLRNEKRLPSVNAEELTMKSNLGGLEGHFMWALFTVKK